MANLLYPRFGGLSFTNFHLRSAVLAKARNHCQDLQTFMSIGFRNLFHSRATCCMLFTCHTVNQNTEVIGRISGLHLVTLGPVHSTFLMNSSQTIETMTQSSIITATTLNHLRQAIQIKAIHSTGATSLDDNFHDLFSAAKHWMEPLDTFQQAKF